MLIKHRQKARKMKAKQQATHKSRGR